jgi:hypothetical protein
MAEILPLAEAVRAEGADNAAAVVLAFLDPGDLRLRTFVTGAVLRLCGGMSAYAPGAGGQRTSIEVGAHGEPCSCHFT